MSRITKFYIYIIFAISALLVFTMGISAAEQGIWKGNVATVAPSQTADGTYIIKTPEELAWISKQVSEGYTELRFKLNNDIYLNDVEKGLYVNEWTPIGSEGMPFKGKMFGNEFSIYGLYINSESSYAGLFGNVGDAYIEKVNLSQGKVKGDNYVSLLCGRASGYSIIKECVTQGDIVTLTGNAGGISGYSVNSVSINCCGFNGSITGSGNRVGGITGCLSSNGNIEKCYNCANINIDGKFIGGIVGTSSGSTVFNCYNMGSISGNNRIGGIVGNNVGNIRYCINVGNISSEGDCGAITGFTQIYPVENCYYLNESCVNGDLNAISKTSIDLKRFNFVKNLNQNGADFLYDYPGMNGGYPILSWQLMIDVWDGTIKKPELYIDGESYMITSAEELAWFAKLVNGTLEDGTPQNTTAKATMLKSVIINIGEKNDEFSMIWEPIGNDDNVFNGKFYGNGYDISGIYIKDGETAGLFGCIGNDAVIENLSVSDASVSGFKTGVLAGVNRGSINKVKVSYSSVNGGDYTGALCGMNFGTVTDCSSIGNTVSGEDYVGGITGENYGEISSSFSLSSVKGINYVGGISGSNCGRISLSFNGKPVSASAVYCGGITGFLSQGEISNCYNTAEIRGKSYCAGIAGKAIDSNITCCYDVGEIYGQSNIAAICAKAENCAVFNCYYDGERINAKDSSAVSLTTAKMTGNTALANMSGFDRNVWNTSADSNYYVYYPQLSFFSLSGYFDFYDSSYESVTFLKYKFLCKAVIDEVVTYYTDISEACEFIGDRKGEIIIFEDITVDEEAVVNGQITVYCEENDRTVKRAENYFGNIFTVNGTLSLGKMKDEYFLTFDGNNQSIKNCNSVVRVNESGKFNLISSSICNNNSNEGGAIYNCGTTELFGGSVYGCKSSGSGGAVSNYGTLNLNGTEIYDNFSMTAGGAVANMAGSTVLNGSKIRNNNADMGGAFYVLEGNVDILLGEVEFNTANQGGGIFVEGGILNVLGGVIRSNGADEGKAVYNKATMNFSDDGFIDNDNDVFLPEGKTVTMTGKVLNNTVCINITPEKYEKGIRVVDGTFAAMNYRRVFINNNEAQCWHINSSGYLLTDEVVEVALVSVLGAYSVYYTSLEEAFEDIGENDAIVTIVDDVKVNETITVKSNVTFLSDGTPRSILKGDDLEGPVFVVESGCSVVIGDNINEDDKEVLYFDGTGLDDYNFIEINEGATGVIYKGSVFHNCNSVNCSALKVDGSLLMYGGKIKDNNCDRGAVYISETGKFDYYDGEISGNGKFAVFDKGEFNLHSNAFVGEDNPVHLSDGKMINLTEDYTAEGIIASVHMDRYVLGTQCVDTTLDKSSYSSRFTVNDTSYYFDENLCIAADSFILKEGSRLHIDKNTKYLSGIQLDVNRAENIKSQFVNENVFIYDLNGKKCRGSDIVGTGFKVYLEDGNSDKYDELTVVLYGDVDGDGVASGEDAVLIGFIDCGLDILHGCFLEAADVNHDGKVDMSDRWFAEDSGTFTIQIDQSVGG